MPRAARKGNPPAWSADDDMILIRAAEAGISTEDISRHFLHRTPTAIRSRAQHLRTMGHTVELRSENRKCIGAPADRDPGETRRASSAARSCEAHLKALLCFGLRHKTDLGMGSAAFLGAAQEHGLIGEHVS